MIMEKKITQEETALYKKQAEQKIGTGDPDAAIAFANRVIEDAPDAEAYVIRATAQLLANNHNSFFQDMDKAILMEPENADLYQKRGIFNLVLERNVEAHSDFECAVKLEPDDPSVYFNRSLTFCKLGNPTAALRDIETVFELNPDKVIECAARTQRAEILMGQNLNMEAFAELTIAIELDNSDAEAHKLRGVVSNQLKEYRIAHYDLSVIPLWSPTSEHYLLRSEACRGLEYLKNADNDRFISVVLQQPRLEKTLNDAIGALNAEHYEEAITLFEKAVSLLPQDVSEILCLLGKAKLELNRTEAAIADFDRAIAADPLHNFEALLCRAKALVLSQVYLDS